MSEAAKRRQLPLGWSRWKVFVAILAVIFIVVPAVDGVLAPDYNVQASVLRGRLAKAETAADFRAFTEEMGFLCRERVEQGRTQARCFRTSGQHIWNWTTFLNPLPEGVVARGEFIDGRKSAEYQVTVERLDPHSI